MSSLIPEGIIPFLLYFILKKGVLGGKMCNLYGAGELLINFTFNVCVFLNSNPENFTIDGNAPNNPLLPTASNLLFILK